MSKEETQTQIGATLLGIITLLWGTMMLFVFPTSANLPAGFRTPIIAFEFAKTEYDLAFLVGDSPQSRANRDKMDAGNRLDMAFPFAYAGFLTLTLAHLALGGRRLLWMVVPIALLMIPFDIYENAILLQITDALRNGRLLSPLLTTLQLATWLKWGALGLTLASLAAAFGQQKTYLAASLAALTGLSIAGCRLSNCNPLVCETMSVLLTLFFLYLTGHMAWQTWQARR